MSHLRSLTLLPGAAPLLIGLAAAATVLAACGGGGSATAASTTGSGAPTSAQRQANGQDAGRFPGVSGLVAEVDGRTLQVQGASTQTAVTWTGTTRFTREVAVSKAAVRAGVCVAVRSLPDGQNGTPSDQSSVIAQSVSISQPVSGRCQVGFGRGGPGRGGVPGAQPTRSGQPTGSPATGGASRARGFGGVGGAFGTVTAVGATGFTVESMVPERPSGTASGSPTTPATTQRRVVTVTTSPATTYTSTVAATASAAKVGTCVTALGTADSTGAIAARSIAVRPAQNGSCVTGFGRPGGLGAATTHG